jgi:glycosyltransferase involved in cell wall biosynthesis
LWKKKRLIYVGRFSKEKNLSLLVDSLSGVRDVELIIAGDGPERDIFLEKLKEK